MLLFTWRAIDYECYSSTNWFWIQIWVLYYVSSNFVEKLTAVTEIDYYFCNVVCWQKTDILCRSFFSLTILTNCITLIFFFWADYEWKWMPDTVTKMKLQMFTQTMSCMCGWLTGCVYNAFGLKSIRVYRLIFVFAFHNAILIICKNNLVQMLGAPKDNCYNVWMFLHNCLSICDDYRIMQNFD